MREKIGAALGIPADRVGIKATTNETLGFVGRDRDSLHPTHRYAPVLHRGVDIQPLHRLVEISDITLALLQESRHPEPHHGDQGEPQTDHDKQTYREFRPC